MVRSRSGSDWPATGRRRLFFPLPSAENLCKSMSPEPFDTRSEAAKRIQSRLPDLQRQVLSFIVGQDARGATDEEISTGLKMQPDTARARRVELMHAGLVQDSGKRRKTKSQRSASVWTAGISREMATPHPGPEAATASNPSGAYPCADWWDVERRKR
jgi:hypothetical protein